MILQPPCETGRQAIVVPLWGDLALSLLSPSQDPVYYLGRPSMKYFEHLLKTIIAYFPQNKCRSKSLPSRGLFELQTWVPIYRHEPQLVGPVKKFLGAPLIFWDHLPPPCAASALSEDERRALPPGTSALAAPVHVHV